MSRPCDRCSAKPAEYDSANDNPMCAEVQMGFGVLAWLCLDCRFKWHNFITSHSEIRNYSRSAFKLDAWRARLNACGEGDIEQGLKLWEEVEDLDQQFAKEAQNWIENCPRDELSQSEEY